jgi:hypothetical protein
LVTLNQQMLFFFFFFFCLVVAVDCLFVIFQWTILCFVLLQTCNIIFGYS